MICTFDQNMTTEIRLCISWSVSKRQNYILTCARSYAIILINWSQIKVIIQQNFVVYSTILIFNLLQRFCLLFNPFPFHSPPKKHTDIYKTIAELINPKQKIKENNGINLFSSVVSRRRTCRQAKIPLEWCNCWQAKPKMNTI